MVDVLDYILGLPVTLGTVGVLEGMQCTPSYVLGRPRHPSAVAGSAVAVLSGDTA